MEIRDKVAFALFTTIYGNAIEDDSTFPNRVWNEMSVEQKALYYHQADAALAAAA